MAISNAEKQRRFRQRRKVDVKRAADICSSRKVVEDSLQALCLLESHVAELRCVFERFKTILE